MAITKEQAIDILDKFDFFEGQRAGRELWNDKPYEVQEEDVRTFSRDVAELKAYIADVVPRSEVDKARQQGYESGKREIARNIYIALYNEIIDARNSNFEAIKERETKHNVNRYEDTFCHYCDGKIHALDGIFYFIDELTKKYMGGKDV